MSVGNTFLNDISDFQKEENARKTHYNMYFLLQSSLFFYLLKFFLTKMDKNVIQFYKYFLTADRKFDRYGLYGKKSAIKKEFPMDSCKQKHNL